MLRIDAINTLVFNHMCVRSILTQVSNEHLEDLLDYYHEPHDKITDPYVDDIDAYLDTVRLLAHKISKFDISESFKTKYKIENPSTWDFCITDEMISDVLTFIKNQKQ